MSCLLPVTDVLYHAPADPLPVPPPQAPQAGEGTEDDGPSRYHCDQSRAQAGEGTEDGGSPPSPAFLN